MTEVNNALSPHGGKLVDRVLEPAKGREKAKKAKIKLPIDGSRATEIMSIAYGFFSPVEGFMGHKEVDSVCKDMRLTSGYIWSIPITFDISESEIKAKGLKEGDTLLLTYQNQPFATMELEEIFSYDKTLMAQKVYGTTEEKHPGVKITYACKDRFLGGKITLINPPKINPPFDKYWYPPKVLRQKAAELGWKKMVAHQTRNVPHTGHEWLMKGAWFASSADAVLVSCVVGEKRAGDYIDEAIVLTHDALGQTGYFRKGTHLTSILLWDMRYAGPKEAIFHAIVRKNLGCTHHMFGRDHAGVGTYYSPYAAHEIFSQVPDLGIGSVLTLEWWYCPVCGEVTYSGLCGHDKESQAFSGTLIRSIIQDGVKPPRLIFRPEVFDLVMESGEKYGFGSPFVTSEYLAKRNPVITVPAMEV
ncbi:MAG: sulfate adenylyltransferase [Chloroflexi bacterium]|nr:sulfate adenylyltransferase [Chloroflexota bacterium]